MITLNMLNCLKDYKRYTGIMNRILDLVWHKEMKSTLEQQYMLSVLHSQYHACDIRSQSISRHGIDPQSWNIPSPASEELMPIDWVIKTLCLTTYMEVLMHDVPYAAEGYQETATMTAQERISHLA